MNGLELRRIRNKFGLTKDAMGSELGYRGSERNNSALIKTYEQGRKRIPLTVASLAFLLEKYYDLTGALPEWPYWPGYDLELEPLKPEAGGDPVETEKDVA